MRFADTAHMHVQAHDGHHKPLSLHFGSTLSVLFVGPNAVCLTAPVILENVVHKDCGSVSSVTFTLKLARQCDFLLVQVWCA